MKNFKNSLEKEMYEKHFSTVHKRLLKALESSKYDSIQINSGIEKYLDFDDQTYPFKRSSFFNFLFPHLDGEGHKIIISKKEISLYIYTPKDFWHKIEDVDLSSIPSLVKVKLFHSMENIDSEIKNDFLNKNIFNLDTRTSDLTFLSLLEETRVQKTEFEIHCVDVANKVAALGHLKVKEMFYNNEGLTELDLHLSYLKAINDSESNLPYNSIIGLNTNSATLHYQFKSKNKINPLKTLLIDAGTTYFGYCSDITRTYSKEIEFQEVINAVQEYQIKLCNEAFVGSSFPKLDDLSHLHLSNLLKELDIINLSSDDIYQNGLSKYFCPHGLGHYLGIQVHDVAAKNVDNLAELKKSHHYLRLLRPLTASNILTIEPGFYFIPMLLEEIKNGPFNQYINWKKVERLLPFGGIRIEDNLAIVSESENVNLTRRYLP